MDQGPREGTERMGPEGPVRAATLSVIVRLWSADGTGLMLRGEVEHVRTCERRFFLYQALTYWLHIQRGDGTHDG